MSILQDQAASRVPTPTFIYWPKILPAKQNIFPAFNGGWRQQCRLFVWSLFLRKITLFKNFIYNRECQIPCQNFSPPWWIGHFLRMKFEVSISFYEKVTGHPFINEGFIRSPRPYICTPILGTPEKEVISQRELSDVLHPFWSDFLAGEFDWWIAFWKFFDAIRLWFSAQQFKHFFSVPQTGADLKEKGWGLFAR